jgi:rare lipoprotein A (peptidoglycan hydrolase)
VKFSLIAFLTAVVFLYMMFQGVAESRPIYNVDRSTWYGPGFYGNSTACGQRYTKSIRGVAVPSSGRKNMKCGTKVTICRLKKCTHIRVIDTGGFRDHQFDLSARTAMDLCRCSKPYTMQVRWTYGWSH